ncbi:hypothetical protein [Sphingomonas phyllosphaerae]|uniref:hypothetical protein n=1 Tax=Sphingomonas phyllosphaerae TaxID=257003 RepID=UPI00041FB338|nr:hypothetical protein [Sphingomonas phyllosphaerae]
MILAALLLLGQAPSLNPPTDWAPLPRLQLGLAAAPPTQLTEFVRREVLAARCELSPEERMLDLVVLVTQAGQVRRIVPRAIGCPSVEQFAAGIVLRAARDKTRPVAADTWYVTTVALTLP